VTKINTLESVESAQNKRSFWSFGRGKGAEQVSLSERFDNGLSTCELVMNLVGYTSLSAGIRIYIASAEITASLALAVFHAIKNYNALAYSKSEKRSQAELYQHQNAQKLISSDITYAAHGVANIIRGTIESFPIIGGISLAVYDYHYDRKITYPNEQKTVNNPLKIRTYIEPRMQDIKNKLQSIWNSVKNYLQSQKNQKGI
jgi:hypothetical protein